LFLVEALPRIAQAAPGRAPERQRAVVVDVPGWAMASASAPIDVGPLAPASPRRAVALAEAPGQMPAMARNSVDTPEPDGR
jgi:hypothetical protein